MKKSRVEVTDHAVMRYLERVYHVDVEGLRRRIGKMADLGIVHGATRVNVGKARLVLEGNKVMTVTGRGSTYEKRLGRAKKRQ